MGRFWEKYYDAARILAGPGDATKRFPLAMSVIGSLGPSEIPKEVRLRHEALERKACTSPRGETVSYQEAMAHMDEAQLKEIADEIVSLHDWAAEQEGRAGASE